MSMSQLLVTGGCGFIGSNFIRYVLDTDPAAHVLNVDALSYAGNPANLADLADHPRYRFLHADITDRDAVRQAVRGSDVVLNFAAESHVDRSIHDARPFVRTNVLGTQVLLDAAREFRIGRVVQISTDECYGSLGPTGAFTEETPLAPNSPYAASKAAADLLDRRYAIDCTKIERELGWRQTVDFETGLRQTVQWYQANAAWVAKLVR